MSRQSSAHLDYNQLLQALVDATDLRASVRHHLETCSACQHQVTRLVQRYDRLGQMANKMSPGPTKAFRLPDRAGAKYRRRGLRPVFAMGMVAAMIMAFTLWGPRYFESTNSPVPNMAQYIEDDDLLTDDIDALVADALPPDYQELASVFESESVEDLIEWIVPSIEEEDDEFEPRA